MQLIKDYYEMKRSLEKLNNDLVLLRAQVAAINKSLEFSPDLERKKIEQVYQEAKLNFPDSVKAHLSDVERFYTQLAHSRNKHLSEQKFHIIQKISALELKIENLKKVLDSTLNAC
jgi:uncharacterized protein YydD (DUF2326 family)